MDKEYTFIDKVGRLINWNALIPPMLDVWRAIQATKDNDGNIVVRVIEIAAPKEGE